MGKFARWITGVLVVLAVLFVVAFLVCASQAKRRGSFVQRWALRMPLPTSTFGKFARSIHQDKRNVQAHEKRPDEWRSVRLPERDVHYVFIRQQTQQDSSVPQRVFLICHGAFFENERSYHEFQDMARVIHADILIVEYPGMGQRQGETLGEDSLTSQYCTDVNHVMDDLGLSWSEVTILGICFGAIAACSLAARHRNDHVRGLVLLKPYTSLPNTTLDVFGLSGAWRPLVERVIPNVHRVPLDEVQWIICPVLCSVGGDDNVCRPRHAEQLLRHMTRASFRRIIVVPKVDHAFPAPEHARGLRTAMPEFWKMYLEKGGSLP